MMSRRLQVLLDETEMEEIRQVASNKKLTVAEWVRQALRRARHEEPLKDSKTKLAVVREAYAHSFPSPDIKRMLAEVEQGYHDDPD